MSEKSDVDCPIVCCQAKEDDAELLRTRLCPYCINNKKAKSPEKDFSTALREGGY